MGVTVPVCFPSVLLFLFFVLLRFVSGRYRSKVGGALLEHIGAVPVAVPYTPEPHAHLFSALGQASKCA